MLGEIIDRHSDIVHAISVKFFMSFRRIKYYSKWDSVGPYPTHRFFKSILCIISMSLSIIIEYSIRCPQKLSSLFYRSFALLCSRYGRVYLFSLCCDFTARGFSFYRYPIVQCLFRDGFGKRLYRLLAHIVVRRSTQSSHF